MALLNLDALPFSQHRFPVSAMTATATAVAAAALWYFLRRPKVMDETSDLLKTFVLHESVDRERSVRLGSLSAVQVFPRARTSAAKVHLQGVFGAVSRRVSEFHVASR